MSNTSLANQKRKVSSPVPDTTESLWLKEKTKEILGFDFPGLNQASNALYVILATWGLESGFRIWHNNANSRHNKAVMPSRTNECGKYYYSNTIQNLLTANPGSTAIRNGVEDGWYAHGISAVMGYYLVKGTPTHTNFKSRFPSVVDSYGLAVNPGERITDLLFPNTEAGKIRSIAAGLVVFANHYDEAFRKFKDPETALMYSTGSYLGWGARGDPNGATAWGRINAIYAEGGDLSKRLTKLDVQMVETSNVLRNKGVIAATGKIPSTAVVNNISRLSTASISPTTINDCKSS